MTSQLKLRITNADIFKRLFCHPWLSQRIKKWTDISLFDAPTIVQNLLYFRKVFLKIYFYIPFLSLYFGAPGLLNGLKLKLTVYIIKLYNSLKNWNFCMSFKNVCKGHIKNKYKILRHPVPNIFYRFTGDHLV